MHENGRASRFEINYSLACGQMKFILRQVRRRTWRDHEEQASVAIMVQASEAMALTYRAGSRHPASNGLSRVAPDAVLSYGKLLAILEEGRLFLEILANDYPLPPVDFH